MTEETLHRAQLIQDRIKMLNKIVDALEDTDIGMCELAIRLWPRCQQPVIIPECFISIKEIFDKAKRDIKELTEEFENL